MSQLSSKDGYERVDPSSNPERYKKKNFFQTNTYSLAFRRLSSSQAICQIF